MCPVTIHLFLALTLFSQASGFASVLCLGSLYPLFLLLLLSTVTGWGAREWRSIIRYSTEHSVNSTSEPQFHISSRKMLGMASDKKKKISCVEPRGDLFPTKNLLSEWRRANLVRLFLLHASNFSFELRLQIFKCCMRMFPFAWLIMACLYLEGGKWEIQMMDIKKKHAIPEVKLLQY